MNPLLQKFKQEFLESILEFLWRQWSLLGVPGYRGKDDLWIIDPEALIMFSLTFGRSEPRLLDEIINWLHVHGNLINIQRLKRVVATESFASHGILSAIAAVISETGNTSKWGRISSADFSKHSENLFLNKIGEEARHYGKTDPVFEKYGFLRGPYRLRAHTQSIQIMKHTGLVFRLRSLLGINARVEILLYLLFHKTGHPRKIAREIYYFQKTVQDALVEMGGSEIIQVRSQGREKHYRLAQDDWYRLLKIQEPYPQWINWPLLFRALEQIWLKLCEPDFFMFDELYQSSELRQLMTTVRGRIESSGIGQLLTDDSHYLGIEYTPVFMKDIKQVLEFLNS